MSTMGITVFNNNNNNNNNSSTPATATNNDREQLMLLRTLQDNERNIIGGSTQRVIAPKNVSVISVNTSVGQQQQQQPQQQLQQTQQNKNEQQSQQSQNNQVLPPYDPSRLKKHGKNGQPPPIAVAKRNARERNRVKQVNNGFATLRQHIPSHVAQGYGDRGKKLSKVETLRMAVEYIRGLQRLLAEADGLDYDAISASARNQANDSPMMIPSPTGSVYSNSTHNGSGDVLCMDDQQSVDHMGMDEDVDGDSYMVDEDDEETEAGEKRDSKRFRATESAQNRLSENQNRPAQRRRHDSPTTYYVTRQPNTFGDEENIEPTNNLNNKNNNTTLANNNNNNVLATFSPILLQASPVADATVKREIQLIDEDDTQRSTDDDVITTAGSNVVLATSSPYTGEILIENPETGRLVPLKLEDHDANTQLVYVTTSAEGLPTATYYKHELGSFGAVGTGVEFMDVMSWWEQEQGRGPPQTQQAANNNHDQLVVQHHQQPHHVQHHNHHHHQQIAAAAGQQRLAHV